MCILNKGEHLNVYHVGNPEEIAIRDVVKKVAAYFDRTAEIVTTPLQQGSCMRRCPNIDKLRALGFNPKISLDAGLPTIAEWYVEHANERKCA